MNDIASGASKSEASTTKSTIVEPGMEREFLTMLLENLDVGVAILDSDLRYRMLSNASLRQLKLQDGDIALGDPLSKMHTVMTERGLMTPEIMTQNELSESEQIEKSRVGTDPSSTSRLIKLGDGTTHRFHRKTLDNGYTLSVASDVTELVEKQTMLDEALTLGSAAFWIYDFGTKHYTLSETLVRAMPKDMLDNLDRHGIFTMVHPDDRTIVRQAMAGLSRAKTRFEMDMRTLSSSGDYRWTHTSAEMILDGHGRPLKIRAFVRDIHDERMQKIELERVTEEAVLASKAKSEFLANMSHEIRTPMNGILGMAELLEMSNIDDRQEEYVRVITSSASALLCIINDILDFSKIEAGALELDPTPFNLKSSVNDVTALLLSTAQDKGLELIINYPSDLPQHFIGDAGRIRQVLTNLVGNAIKFTSEGHVRIDIGIKPCDADPASSLITMNVIDTGIGIEPTKLQAIFDKFTQADGSTTRVYGGTGLGLTITKRIAEMMGGDVNVSSELGVGSTFGASFPLKRDQKARADTFDIANVSGKRALIVDDIEVNRTILCEQLAGWGMTSHQVSNGIEAAEALKDAASSSTTQPYDIILLDYLMPGVNGRELASLLAKQSSIPIPPIVMLSSCDQSVSSEELAEIGIETYLVKPVRERRLFETLGRIFGRRELGKDPASDTLSESTNDYQTIQAVPEKTDLDIVAEMLETSAPAQPSAPVAPEPTPNAAVAKTETSESKAPRSQKQEILVAEDFPLNRDVVRLMLVETAFEPVFAENGKIASELYIAEPDRFPLVLMDVSMPVMDGFQATQAIRDWEAQQDDQNVPIIALTGHALKNDRQECLNAGMNHYLTKPVKQKELLEVLEHYSGRAVHVAMNKVA